MINVKIIKKKGIEVGINKNSLWMTICQMKCIDYLMIKLLQVQ